MSGEVSQESSQVHRPKTKKSEALWMMTFADLSFVLMCFFALLLSFSKPNKHQFENVVQGMASKPEGQGADKYLKDVAQEITSEVKARKLENSASVKLESNGLAIEFKDNLIFAPGSASANQRFQAVTSRVLNVIAKAPNKYRITIEGHTDDTPLVGHRRFNSNWELSAARGISLLEMFQKQGVNRDRMSVVAYADTRPKVTPEGKRGAELQRARAANRRVVIRLE